MKIQPQKQFAAGIEAVYIALKMGLSVVKPLRLFKVLSRLNQKKGVDCPGCAWPDPENRSSLGEFCENGVKAIAEETMNASADEGFFAKHKIEYLRTQSDYWLGQKGRLTHPLICKEGNSFYEPLSWENAFEVIASKLTQLKDPNEAIFYTSGRSSNEAAFLYQLFVRQYGTNNLPDCSNMCHESSGVGLSRTLGIGKGSITLKDFEHAEVILIFGQNPGTNHPRMLSALEKAKSKGVKVVVINPLKEAGLVNFKNPQHVKGVVGNGVDIADLYLQIRINEDISLLKAAMKTLLTSENQGFVDYDFIESKTQGFDALRNDLANYSISVLESNTGLKKEQLSKFYQLLLPAKKVIACWAMGITQHENGVANVQEIVNLLLLKGSIGKIGAGTCPVRGHSNVQGDRSMGIWEHLPKNFSERIPQVFGFTPPKSPGYNVVETIEALHSKKASVFVGLGGNFVSAAPDSHFTEDAFSSADLTVHVSTKLNRTHLYPGKTSIILPCLGSAVTLAAVFSPLVTSNGNHPPTAKFKII